MLFTKVLLVAAGLFASSITAAPTNLAPNAVHVRSEAPKERRYYLVSEAVTTDTDELPAVDPDY